MMFCGGVVTSEYVWAPTKEGAQNLCEMKPTQYYVKNEEFFHDVDDVMEYSQKIFCDTGIKM